MQYYDDEAGLPLEKIERVSARLTLLWLDFPFLGLELEPRLSHPFPLLRLTDAEHASCVKERRETRIDRAEAERRLASLASEALRFVPLRLIGETDLDRWLLTVAMRQQRYWQQHPTIPHVKVVDDVIRAGSLTLLSIKYRNDASDVFMPGEWYRDEFGIQNDRLRKRTEIARERHGNRNFYSVLDAMRVWPNLVTYGPAGKAAEDEVNAATPARTKG